MIFFFVLQRTDFSVPPTYLQTSFQKRFYPRNEIWREAFSDIPHKIWNKNYGIGRLWKAPLVLFLYFYSTAAGIAVDAVGNTYLRYHGEADQKTDQTNGSNKELFVRAST